MYVIMYVRRMGVYVCVYVMCFSTFFFFNKIVCYVKNFEFVCDVFLYMCVYRAGACVCVYMYMCCIYICVYVCAQFIRDESLRRYAPVFLEKKGKAEKRREPEHC